MTFYGYFLSVLALASAVYRHEALFAVSNDEKPILIICSYNPAAHQTSVTISDYMDEYSKPGQDNAPSHWKT